jgi:hypothetical protein
MVTHALMGVGGTSVEGFDRMMGDVEAARLLGLSPATLRKWRRLANDSGDAGASKRLPFVKVGPKSVRYRESDLLDFIQAGTRGGSNIARVETA